jgi:hypothetical protein
MRALLKSFVILAVVSSIPDVSYSVAAAEAPGLSHRIAHHKEPRFPKATAWAPEPAAVEPSRPALETDGLSRSDDDCAAHGCIDH